MVTYEANVVIFVERRFLSTFGNRIYFDFGVLSLAAISSGLYISLYKTELILFSQKYSLVSQDLKISSEDWFKYSVFLKEKYQAKGEKDNKFVTLSQSIG